MILSSPTSPGGQKWKIEGDCLGWGDLSSQMERTDSPKQRLGLGCGCKKSQCPLAEQALFQRVQYSYPRASKKSQIFPWIPVSHLVDSSAPRPFQSQLFPIAKCWGLLESIGWGLLTKREVSAASSHKAMCPNLPLNSPVLLPSSLPHFLSLTPNTNLHTPTQPHAEWKWVNGMAQTCENIFQTEETASF